jgi:hypothetical protein
MIRWFGKVVLTPFLVLLPLPAAAAYEINKLALGTSEKDVRRAFPSAHCKALEWASRAADRRCDDSRVAYGGVEVRVTFYLKKDALEAFDARFNTRDLERFLAFLKANFGPPQAETHEDFAQKGKKARSVHKVLWERAGERAVLTAQVDKRVGSVLVWRGDFEEEIYRVR